jgi:pimeloyl-ACP methyl ester carboxylesterase
VWYDSDVARITLADGRIIQVHDVGDSNGAPVIVCHGTPASGMRLPAHSTDAAERGLRLIGFDRAGYCGSTPRPERTVGDVADDVSAIADALGLERFGMWGLSGGGPHVLACAALLSDRVVGVVSMASPAPYDADGLDWLAGMGKDNLEEFGASVAGRTALEAYLRPQAEAMLGADDRAADSLASLLAPVDAAVMASDLGRHIMESMRAGLAERLDGWVDDDLAFVAPWGFDLGEIGVPVLLWHGEPDRFVPFAHGRWLAERIPGVDARFFRDEGHLSLLERVPEAHAWLAERLQA